jgi:hypothetical protein
MRFTLMFFWSLTIVLIGERARKKYPGEKPKNGMNKILK